MKRRPNTITVAVAVNAPIEKLWHYWTEPRHILRWNNASPDWCTLKAINDLKTGGHFSYNMAAKDGSFSFDFEGRYDNIKKYELIEYTMADGRKAKVIFSDAGNETTITEEFEAETAHTEEIQKSGWQAILDNFKNHVEAVNKMVVINFEISIHAPAEKVFAKMIDEKAYREWTAEFNSTSYFKGTWNKGSKILFIGVDKDGTEGGMVSRIRENIPGKFISIEHLGLLKGKEEITSGPEVEAWAGSLENYTFKTDNGSTIVQVDMDSNEDYRSYFMEAWPRALNKLKEICEQ